MVTRKTVTEDNDELWQVMCQPLMPEGLPRETGDPEFDTEFSGGYPDRYVPPFTLEWDNDFTAEAEEEWTRRLRRARRRVDAPTDAETDEHTAVLKAWNQNVVIGGQTPTDAQRDAMLTAMMHLWRLQLRDED